MVSSKEFLVDLKHEIETHPAVNHMFLNRLATIPFAKQDYGVFAANHYPLVCLFTNYLERLLIRSPDSETKLWLAKVLVDEYGEGSEGKDHATMYSHFLQAAGGDLTHVRTSQLPVPAYEFITTHWKMIAERPFWEGLGAVGPGHEWAIPKMFSAVIPGLRTAGFTEEEIAYFTLHVEQDEDHGLWLEQALARYATTSERQAEIRRGALASLEARRKFWSGVQRAVMRFRQPRAIRPDGLRQRSASIEMLLTAWDWLPFAHRAEEKVLEFRDRNRPNLVQLMQTAKSLSA
jgi:pyrroloquinoline-quinone synthase